MSTTLETKNEPKSQPMGRAPMFYGWWIVVGCLLVAVVGWSLTVFGMGVYIHVLAERPGFSISLISTAVTISYLVSAACLISVGAAIARLGPKPVIAAGVHYPGRHCACLGLLPAAMAGLPRFRCDGFGPIMSVPDVDQHDACTMV